MADELVVRTNNRPRDILHAYELTGSERAEFDYLDWDKIDKGEDDAHFFRYKGDLYDLGDAEVNSSTNNPFPNWDGYYSQTFFSGVLVKYAPDSDYEQVIVGNYYT